MTFLLLLVVALVAAGCTTTFGPETFTSIDVPESTPSTSVSDVTGSVAVWPMAAIQYRFCIARNRLLTHVR